MSADSGPRQLVQSTLSHSVTLNTTSLCLHFHLCKTVMTTGINIVINKALTTVPGTELMLLKGTSYWLWVMCSSTEAGSMSLASASQSGCKLHLQPAVWPGKVINLSKPHVKHSIWHLQHKLGPRFSALFIADSPQTPFLVPSELPDTECGAKPWAPFLCMFIS